MANLSTRPTITQLNATTTAQKHTLSDDATYWQIRVRSMSGAAKVRISADGTPTDANSAVMTSVDEVFGTPQPLAAGVLSDPYYATDAGTAELEIVEW